MKQYKIPRSHSSIRTGVLGSKLEQKLAQKKLILNPVKGLLTVYSTQLCSTADNSNVSIF